MPGRELPLQWCSLFLSKHFPTPLSTAEHIRPKAPTAELGADIAQAEDKAFCLPAQSC